MSTAPRPDASGSGAAYPVADLERRFYAFVVDRLLDFGVCAALAVALWLLTDGESPALVAGVSLGVLAALWLVFAVSTGVAGTTPGKAALKLRLVSEGTGEPVGVGKALVRSLVLAVSGLPTFGFGLAALAWTAVADTSGQRRGWHDLVAGSVVLDVRDVPESVAEAADDAPRHVVNLTAMRLVPAPAANVPSARRTVPDSEHSMRREPLAKDLSGPTTGAPTGSSRTTQRVVPGAPAAGAVDHSPRAAEVPPAPSAPQPAAPAAAQHRGQSGPPTVPPVPVAPQQPYAPPASGPVPPPPAPTHAPAPSTPQAPAHRAAQPPAQQPPAQQGFRPPPAPAPAGAPQHAAAPPSLPPGAARWRATFDDGQSFVVEGLALVGRRPTPGPGEQVRHVVPLSSPEMSVSKTHAHFGPAPDGVIVVTDRGSTNGTILIRSGIGRQLSPGKPATLRDGDRVMFGDRAMTLSLEG